MTSASILGAALVLALAGPAAAERSFGLVVGIDDYAYIPDLHGAVNDAEDIAAALAGIGAEVTLLTDADATRAAVLGAWEGILERAAPGDLLVVSYAGHGSNEPEHVPGSERDGRDENFLLAGFAPRGVAAGERIRDDEIAELLARSAHLEVIFVADACHSGTVTRDIEPALGYRYVTPEGIEADPLPPPPPPPGGAGEEGVALFLAAVNEAEKVPEVLIDGTPRGALSYAFASGIRGAADLDGDGTLTKGELEVHVRRTVRQKSDGIQLPQARPAGQEARALLALRGTAPPPVPPPPAPAPLLARAFADLPLLPVTGDWSGVDGVSQGPEGILRREGALLRSSVGDPVAVAPDRAARQAIADKHRLVSALGAIARPGLDIAFDAGDRTYREGEVLRIAVTGRSTRYLTLFNLGADGTLSYLYPVVDGALGIADPDHAPLSDPLALPVRVGPPFGADHVVAVETATPAALLRGGLASLSGRRDMAALWDLLRASGGRVAVFPFFTGEAT